MARAMLSKGSILGSQILKIGGSSSAAFDRHLVTKSAAFQQVAAAIDQHQPPPGLASAKPISEIPGPRRWPLFGCVPSMFLDKDYELKRLYKYWDKMIATYGPTVRLDMPGFGIMVLVANPDDCQTLTRVTMDDPQRSVLLSLKKIRKDAVEYYDNRAGILIENGEEWKRVRSRVQTPMMKPKNVTSYLTQMDAVALDFLDRIAQFQNQNGEMPSTFQTEIYKWALESVSLVALDRRLGCFEPSNSEAMILIKEANTIFETLTRTEFGPQLWRFFKTPSYKQLLKSHDEFLRVADHHIRKTETQLLGKESTNEEELTLMQTLLLTPGLSRKDVVTFMLDMLVAGIDTTSHTLGFTLYLLAKNPDCQKKLQDEVDAVLGDHQGPLTPKHLGKFSYMKTVVKESLRIFPLAMGTARNLNKDVVIGGYLLPKGCTVMTYNMHMGLNEEFFQRPQEFIPERWSRDRPYGEIHPFAHLPFGFGPRMCIGRRIAEQELYTFLARAMQRYTVDYKFNDMSMITRMVTVPSEPLRFNFIERQR